MKLSAKDLIELKIIDEIISEPVGGAHRDKSLILHNVRNSISTNLEYFKTMQSEEIVNHRKNKFLKIGREKGFIDNPEYLSDLKSSVNNFNQIFKLKKIKILTIAILAILLISSLFFL